MNRHYQRRWWILAVLCLSLVLVSVSNTSLNVGLPSLARSLHATASQLQWIVDAYSLVFAGFLLTAGSLGDRYGRKGALNVGLVIFGLASAGAPRAPPAGPPRVPPPRLRGGGPPGPAATPAGLAPGRPPAERGARA